LACKRKALKVDLRVFGNIEKKKKLLLEDLRVLEGLEEGRILSEKANWRKGIIDLERITLGRGKLEVEIDGFVVKR
jgi:hypothetical protein